MICQAKSRLDANSLFLQTIETKKIQRTKQNSDLYSKITLKESSNRDNISSTAQAQQLHKDLVLIWIIYRCVCECEHKSLIRGQVIDMGHMFMS